jgi:hypothetical protein
MLRALGYAAAFAVTFSAIAIGAWHAGVEPTSAAIRAGFVVLFIRIFARSVPAMQRLIDRLHPEPNAVRPDAVPGWAVGLYWAIGLALVFLIIWLEETYTYAAVATFAAWGAGANLLTGFWIRRDGTTAIGTAFIAFDARLDAFAARHRATLRPLGVVLAFAMLTGGVALHAFETGAAEAALARCGAPCGGRPLAAALVFGAAAAAFVYVYALLLGSMQRALIDPWKHVRPEPAPATPPRWTVVLLILIGFGVFWTIASTGDTSAVPRSAFHIGTAAPPGGAGRAVTLGAHALLEWIVGWCVGGRGVLGFFWPKPAIHRQRAPT